MNTSELKLDLINRISGLTDQGKLKELLMLLRFQSNDAVFHTTDEEKEAILESRKQISDGDVISNDDFQKEIREWLEK